MPNPRCKPGRAGTCFDQRSHAQETEIRFEAAVSRLEEIVESLERGEPDLATALAKYETGVRLLTQCYGLLERADRAVAIARGR